MEKKLSAGPHGAAKDRGKRAGLDCNRAERACGPKPLRMGLLFISQPALFSFLYLKKIKISKIYVRFELFQKYPGRPPIE